MQAPIVHLNGSSKESLVDAYIGANGYICEAINAISEVFHHRDYYVQDGAWERALEEHTKLFKQLEAIKDQLIDIAIQIANQ